MPEENQQQASDEPQEKPPTPETDEAVRRLGDLLAANGGHRCEDQARAFVESMLDAVMEQDLLRRRGPARGNPSQQQAGGEEGEWEPPAKPDTQAGG